MGAAREAWDDAARAILGEVIRLRRELHGHPELGLELPETRERVLRALDGRGLEVETAKRTSAVVARVRGGSPGPTLLLRADMDALPIREETGLEFASRREGVMHACGHDAHTAMLVGAAHVLAERRDTLRGHVVFLFQPGEEGYGGARICLEEGLLDREPTPDAAFAIHVDSTLPSGLVAARAGTILAAMDSFEITVRGRGGHGSMPHLALDPVPVAAEMVGALQSFVTRRVNPFDPVVCSVTQLHAGTASNVIPETATLSGTLRSVSEAGRAGVVEGLRRVASGVAQAHGAEAEVVVTPGYPPTVNAPEFVERVAAVARAVGGEGTFLELPSPIMGSEDFSYILQRIPGALVFLGARPPRGEPAPLHSNRMQIDENALARGVALHAALAAHLLGGA